MNQSTASCSTASQSTKQFLCSITHIHAAYASSFIFVIMFPSTSFTQILIKHFLPTPKKKQTQAQSPEVLIGQKAQSSLLPSFSVSKLTSITKLYGTDLIVTVHHFQSPTRLLFFHMPQGTLQAEDNIFILLYNLYKNAEAVGERSPVSSKLQPCFTWSIEILCGLLKLHFISSQ